MNKRSGKFYYRNEKEVLASLGLRQVPGSGNGWINKEDGENEHVLCQLKSTDADCIQIKKIDLDRVIYHAAVSHKLPLFAIQFLEMDELFLLVRPADLADMSRCLENCSQGFVKTLASIADHDPVNREINKIESDPVSRDVWDTGRAYKKEGKPAWM